MYSLTENSERILQIYIIRGKDINHDRFSSHSYDNNDNNCHHY